MSEALKSLRPEDERWMRRAIQLSKRGLGRTSPNPAVGCVIARGEQLLAEGWHRAAGQPHAEAEALARSSGDASQASLYVTLEPCDHQGRTGPCTEAILAAGISRVVYACPDPTGKGGADRLRGAGVEVVEGLLQETAAAVNEAWLTAIRQGRPFLALKLATSLDGRIATAAGDSRWISGERSRKRVARLRDSHDAVLVGTGTLRKDDPRLTARIRGGRHPLRAVLDPSLSCSADARVLQDGGPTLLFAGDGALGEGPEGAEVVRVEERAGRLDLHGVLKELGDRGCVSVLAEGGAALAGSLLAASLVNRLHVFVAPVILGEGALPLARLSGPEQVADALRLRDVKIARLDEDAYITGWIATCLQES